MRLDNQISSSVGAVGAECGHDGFVLLPHQHDTIRIQYQSITRADPVIARGRVRQCRGCTVAQELVLLLCSDACVCLDRISYPFGAGVL